MAWRENATFTNISVDGKFWDCSIAVSAEDTNVVTCAITITDAVSGGSPGKALAFPFYLSSDSAGQVPEAGTDCSVAAGTDGAVVQMSDGGSSIAGFLVTETTGEMDLTVTDTGSDTYYLNVIMPDGRVVTSSVITLAA
jgi:hypothetical protein